MVGNFFTSLGLGKLCIFLNGDETIVGDLLLDKIEEMGA